MLFRASESQPAMKKLNLFIAILLSTIGVVGAQEQTPIPGWPEQLYAPYIYSTGYPIAYMAEQAQTTYLTLAFIFAAPNECQAGWSGGGALDKQPMLVSELKKLRERGGDVIVSFGGAAGDELAMVCTDVESLTAQYQAVIDAYQITRLDFDIEGEEIHDADSIERRSQAIAALQARAKEADSPLHIQFTLPVAPTGLTQDGVNVLQSAIDHDINIDVVNIMTMDFGKDNPPDKMGELTIQAAESTFEQLQDLYPDKDEADVWKMLGLTPMVGLNDVTPQVFTLADAEAVIAFANERGIGHLAIWSLIRDKSCPGEAKNLSDACSGVTQEDFGYSAIFSTLGSAE